MMMEPEYEQFTRRFTSSIQSRFAMTAGEIERFAEMQHAEIEQLQIEVGHWRDEAQSEIDVDKSYEVAFHNVCVAAGLDTGMGRGVLEEELSSIAKAAAEAESGELKAEIKRLRAIVDPIEELRGVGCDFFTLHVEAAHEAGRKREAVDVVAAWTNWNEMWFWGDTIEEVLAAAVEAKRAAEKGGETDKPPSVVVS